MVNPEIKIGKIWECGMQGRKERWRERRDVLRKLGFTNEKVIHRLRNNSTEKVKENIEILKGIHPYEKWAIAVIEKFPDLAIIDIEKGRMKIESANKLLESYQFPKVSEKEMLEKFPQFVDYDPHRITFPLLILGELSKKLPKEEKLLFAPKAIGIVRSLLFFNPHLVFSVLEKRPKEKRPKINGDVDGVREEMRSVGTDVRKIKGKEGRKIIDEVKNKLPDTLENLKGSKDPYENEFLLKLAQQLELLGKSKEKNNEK